MIRNYVMIIFNNNNDIIKLSNGQIIKYRNIRNGIENGIHKLRNI